MKAILFIFVAFLILGTGLHAATYKVETKYPIGGTEGWDYITVDSAARRLYVSHGTRVNVLDEDTGKPVGVIEDTPGVHGIAIASNIDHGFTTNGKENYEALETVTTQSSAKTMAYDGKSKKVFLPAAEMETTSASGPTQKPKKAVKEGAFAVLVVSK